MPLGRYFFSVQVLYDNIIGQESYYHTHFFVEGTKKNKQSSILPIQQSFLSYSCDPSGSRLQGIT